MRGERPSQAGGGRSPPLHATDPKGGTTARNELWWRSKNNPKWAEAATDTTLEITAESSLYRYL